MSYWDDDVVKDFTGFFQEDAVTSSDMVDTSTTASKQVRRRPDRFEGQVRRRPDRFEGQVRRHPDRFEGQVRRHPDRFEGQVRRHPDRFEGQVRRRPDRFEGQVRRHPDRSEGQVRSNINSNINDTEKLKKNTELAWLKYVNFMKAVTNSLPEGTEWVKDSPHMTKYAHLMETSYEANAGKSVQAYLDEHSPGWQHVEDISTPDDVVLHNPTLRETVVSHRGTTTPKDWATANARTMLPTGGRTTSRLVNAEKTLVNAIRRFGVQKLTTIGHSLGGNISSWLGLKYDLKAVGFDPAISLPTVQEILNGEHSSNMNKLKIYATHGDTISANRTVIRGSPLVEVEHVNTIAGKGATLLNNHSTTHFHPEPNASGEVLRNNTKTSIKGAGFAALNAAGIVLQARQTYIDVKADTSIKNKGDRAGAIETDVAKGGLTYGGGWVAGGYIMDAAAAEMTAAGAVAVAGAPVFVAGAAAMMAAVGVGAVAETVAEKMKKHRTIAKINHEIGKVVKQDIKDEKTFFKHPTSSHFTDMVIGRSNKKILKHTGHSISHFFKHGF